MPSSKLFENGTIITWDADLDNFKVLHDASLLVQDDRVAEVWKSGAELDVSRLPNDVERISIKGKILSPGFIDTHRHSWHAVYRTLGPNLTGPEYMPRWGSMSPAREFFAGKDVYYSSLAALYESMNAGVTTFVDHAHHNWDEETGRGGLDASVHSGGRVYWCYGFHPAKEGYTHEKQVEKFKEWYAEETWRSSAATIGISYDGFAFSSTEEIQEIANLAKQNDIALLTTHHSGGKWAADNGPKVIYKAGLLDGKLPVILSHAHHLDEEDRRLLRTHDQYFSITPEAEMAFGVDHPIAHEVMDQACMGTDDNFNHSLDMITQGRLWLQATRRTLFRENLEKGIAAYVNPMSHEDAFYLMTRSGGLALRREDLGVIKVGAKADLVVFDGDTPNMAGWSDAIAAVLLHSNVGDVRHVLIDGKWRKKDGKLLPTTNGETWESLREQYTQSSKKIQGLLTASPIPELEETSVFGGPLRCRRIVPVSVRRQK